MNEYNKLIKNDNYINIVVRSVYTKNRFILKDNQFFSKLIIWSTIVIIILIILFINMIFVKGQKSNNNDYQILNIITQNQTENNTTGLQNEAKEIKEIKNETLKIFINNTNLNNNTYKIPEGQDPECNNLDPINIFEIRLKKNPEILCQSKNSIHLCYKNQMNNIFVAKNGLICKMDNFILDPSKWKDDGYIYNGPVDKDTRGCPLLSEGFFNMKCDIKNEIKDYAKMYEKYINSWDYNDTEDKNYEELAPGKTVFFLSRNQDSPNLYHGGSEFINAFSLMVILNLNPKDIQIIFLESIDLRDNDPLFNLYKYVISGGNTPIYIRDIKEKYHISSAIHIPINWDSPCFILSSVPYCKYPTKTYYLLNKYVQNYMNIPNFIDFNNVDNETFYYPKSILKSNINTTLNEYKKYVTIQWRRVWPKDRKGQQRILGNGPELAEKLAEKLPKGIFIRLVDTSKLPLEEQISILKKTDYFVGVHGAGLVLSIFLPYQSIVHEVLPRTNMNGLRLMSSLSGHKTYSDIINADVRNIDNCEYLFFNSNDFTERVLRHMKESNLIN